MFRVNRFLTLMGICSQAGNKCFVLKQNAQNLGLAYELAPFLLPEFLAKKNEI